MTTDRVDMRNGVDWREFEEALGVVGSDPKNARAPNAVEYVLGAYGACLATGLIINASRRRIELRNLEVTLESTQDNAFSFMGINDDGHSGIDEVKVKLYVQADADETALREVWKHTLRTSPVGNTLVNAVKVTPELSVIA